MTLLEFQNRVRQYRYNAEHLVHNGYGTSPLKGTKRDNVKYYRREERPDGSYRYYYTQQEYNEAKAREKWEAERKAKKAAEERNNMSGYNDWKKKQEEAASAKVSQNNKLNEINNKQAIDNNTNYNKNKASAEAESSREEERVARENEWSRRKAIQRATEKALEQRRNINKNKKAAEAEEQRELAKIEAQKKQDEIDRIKYQGKKNLEEKQKQEAYDKQVEEIKRQGKENLEKAQAEAKWKRQQEEAKQRIAIREAQKEYSEKQSNIGKQIEEQKRKEEETRKQNKEKLDAFKKTSLDNLDNEAQEIYDNLVAINKGTKDKFDVDNDLVKLYKEALAKGDSNFKGDIADYLDTAWYNPFETDADRLDKAKKMLNSLEESLTKNIKEATLDDLQYSNYLTKIKDVGEKVKEQNIKKEIQNARDSFEKIYNGDSKTVKMDSDLKKVLINKLKELDEDYSGDLVKYVKPYLGIWKDDTSFNTINDILDEMEKELLENKNADIYGTFMSKVDKILD